MATTAIVSIYMQISNNFIAHPKQKQHLDKLHLSEKDKPMTKWNAYQGKEELIQPVKSMSL